MQPWVNFDKRLRGNKAKHKFDLTKGRAQKVLERAKLMGNEGLIAKLKAFLEK